MTDSSSNNLEERISAYLDGELSGEEARAVQEELERSPAARDLLRQYGDLRNLIRELPGETLPEDNGAEIQSHVMRRVESKAPVEHGSGKRYWKIALPLLATAAGVMLLVRFNPPKADTVSSFEVAKRASEDASSDSGASTSPKSSVRDALSDEEVAEPPAPAAAPVASAPSEGAMSPTNTLSDLPRPIPEGVELGELDRLPKSKSHGTTIVSTDDGKRSFVMTPKDLESLKVGETVRALQHSGEEISVVDLFVVDKDQALDSLQLILASQEVTIDEDLDGVAETEQEAGKNAPAKPGNALSMKDKSSGDPYSLVAVYVEASGSQLTAALEELKREHQQFVELAIQEPVQTAELSQAINGQVVASDEGKAGEEKRGRFFKGFNSPSDAEKLYKDKPTNRIGLGGDGSDADGNFAGVSRQQAVQVSPQLLDNLSRGQLSRGHLSRSGRDLKAIDQKQSVAKSDDSPVKESTEGAKPSIQSGGEAAVAKKAEEVRAGNEQTEEELTRQFQVLFVLKQRPQTIQKARVTPPARSVSPSEK